MKNLTPYKLFEVLISNKVKTESIKDENVKTVYQYLAMELATSPIAFKIENFQDQFTVKGPFDLRLHISPELEKTSTSPSYNPVYRTVGIKATIGKESIKAANGNDLIKFMKRSISYKHFLKGSTNEKLQKAKIKEILKKEYTDRNLVEYLYFLNSNKSNIQPDNSGPYASSGTSIDRHVYDLTEAIAAWGEENVSAEKLEGLKDDILKKLNLVSGYLISIKIDEYEFRKPKLYITASTTVYYN